MWTFWKGWNLSGEHGMLSKWMANFGSSRVRRILCHQTETQNYFSAEVQQWNGGWAEPLVTL